jgi:hypothetical protein
MLQLIFMDGGDQTQIEPLLGNLSYAHYFVLKQASSNSAAALSPVRYAAFTEPINWEGEVKRELVSTVPPVL